MITKNLFNIFTGRNYYVFWHGPGGSGNGVNSNASYDALRQNSNSVGYLEWGKKVALDVGFSDTAESVDDYKLIDGNGEPGVTQKLTFIQAISNTRGDNDLTNISAIFENQGEESVTVKEVGIYFGCVSGQNNPGEWAGCVARKVLATPVIIAPGEKYLFTYIIRINV